MNNLSTYIIEKLHLNKDSKVINDYDKVIQSIKDTLDYIYGECNNSIYKNKGFKEKWFNFKIDHNDNWIYMKCTEDFFKDNKASDTYNILCLLSEYLEKFGLEHMNITRRISDYTFIFKNWKFKDE